MTAADLARLGDADLEREVARLDRRLDRLNDATWPGAHRERAEIRDRLARMRAEAEQRRQRRREAEAAT